MQTQDRSIIRILLEAMPKTSLAAARGPLVDALPKLIPMFPDLVADLFANIGMEVCSGIVIRSL